MFWEVKIMHKFAVSVYEIFGRAIVRFNDRSFAVYDAYKLTRNWFRMSNDGFFRYYGFNYVPSSNMQRWYRRKYFGEN